MDEETVLTIEAEGMPVRLRSRRGSLEAHLDVDLLWITSLHEVCLSGWSRLGLLLAGPRHGLLFCGDGCNHTPV